MHFSVSDANKKIVSLKKEEKSIYVKNAKERTHIQLIADLANLFEDDETKYYDDMEGGKDIPHANDMAVQADVVYNHDTACIQSHGEFLIIVIQDHTIADWAKG